MKASYAFLSISIGVLPTFFPELAAAAPPRLDGLQGGRLLAGHVPGDVQLQTFEPALDGIDLRLELLIPLAHQPGHGGVAGLPVSYIVQTLNDFKNDLRKPGDPRKVNVNQMIAFAKNLTPEEMQTAAEYFASTPWTQWVRVVETRMVPKTEAEGSIFFKVPGKLTEPIGMRIIETPEDDEQTEPLRNPRSGFVAYAPMGSLKKGEVLVTTGGNGKTVACINCHGADLRGNGPVPGIAGRSPSYLARQMYDIQVGARHGEWAELMKPVVAKLTNEDFVAIAAYVSSRPMPPAPGSKLQTN